MAAREARASGAAATGGLGFPLPCVYVWLFFIYFFPEALLLPLQIVWCMTDEVSFVQIWPCLQKMLNALGQRLRSLLLDPVPPLCVIIPSSFTARLG